MSRIVHPIAPLWCAESRFLILGSFPSVKSRESEFFYGHPQNRFWRVLASVFDQNTPQTIEEKTAFLLHNHIALWDVIGSCEISGSSDSSIKNVTVNDISCILKAADIRQIYVNGKTAEKFYHRYLRNRIGRDAICLPSTSPANASFGLDRLVDAWKRIRLDNFDVK